MRWPLIACGLAVLLLSACGSRKPLPVSCVQMQAGDVLAALRRAPTHVALQDGTRISDCVARALDDAELQAVGNALTGAAFRLGRAQRTSDTAAYRLGFLIGATERGATHSPGAASELANRLVGSAGFSGGPRRTQLTRGRAAGRRAG